MSASVHSSNILWILLNNRISVYEKDLAKRASHGRAALSFLTQNLAATTTLDSARYSSTSTEWNQTIMATAVHAVSFQGTIVCWPSHIDPSYYLLYVGELMSVKRINCPLSILLWAVNQIESRLQWCCLAWKKKISILNEDKFKCIMDPV